MFSSLGSPIGNLGDGNGKLNHPNMYKQVQAMEWFMYKKYYYTCIILSIYTWAWWDILEQEAHMDNVFACAYQSYFGMTKII